MKVYHDSPMHLTYCLNIHPGETWEENLEAIRTKALEVRDLVTPPGKSFGLGLRLSRRASETLSSSEALRTFKRFLKEHDLYVFTINGFPFGDFHGTRVKENVYAPDWQTGQRLDYTRRLGDILAELLPENVSGSISTLPCSYKPWIRDNKQREKIIHHLVVCVSHLAKIAETSGKEIHVGLEPEPDCFLETTEEVIAFFNGDLSSLGAEYLANHDGCSRSKAGEMLRRHLGICFDTCHMSIQFEDLPRSLSRLRRHGIRISKIHLSAALKVIPDPVTREQLTSFCDPVYLHQVKAKGDQGIVSSYGDLREALDKSNRHGKKESEWRIHFHVPLYFQGQGAVRSTAEELGADVIKEAVKSGCEHFEIETYTFDVLPKEMRTRGLVQSIVDEYGWVREHLFPPEKA